MEKKLVSVVVPFYNAQKFLDRCINSILMQTYENIELILVNNCSTDDSEKIAMTYKEDERVKYFICNKKGVSFARNEGINKASGKWLLFVDADDYLDSTIIENLVNKAVENSMDAGCVEIGFADVDVKCNLIKDNINLGNNKIFSKEEMLEELFYSTLDFYRGYLWNKLFDLNLIKDNKIKFDSNIAYNEDRLFILEYINALEESKKVYFVPKIGYYYVHHEESAMGDRKNRPVEKVITEIIAYERMEEIIIKTGKYKNALCKLVNQGMDSCFGLLMTLSFENAKKEKKYLINYMDSHKNCGFKRNIKKIICKSNFLTKIVSRRFRNS